MKTEKIVIQILAMQSEGTHIYYPMNEYHHGASSGLRRFPAVMNEMIRRMLMPKVGNSDKVCHPYYEIIRAVMTSVMGL